MNNACEITNKIDKLKPIPPAANQIMEMAASDLAELMLVDPVITASLLRVCDSAYFGLAVQFDSIQHTIALLGIDQIIELVILHYVADHLNAPQKRYGLAEGELWKQSVATAFLAKATAIKKGVKGRH